MRVTAVPGISKFSSFQDLQSKANQEIRIIMSVRGQVARRIALLLLPRFFNGFLIDADVKKTMKFTEEKFVHRIFRYNRRL